MMLTKERRKQLPTVWQNHVLTPNHILVTSGCQKREEDTVISSEKQTKTCHPQLISVFYHTIHQPKQEVSFVNFFGLGFVRIPLSTGGF